MGGWRAYAAVFVADVEGGDAEVILLPPDRAERRSLAVYIHSPNLDEHFRTGVFVFTGGTYESILAQFPSNPANRRTPDAGAVLDEQLQSVLRSLSASYQTRLVLDLLNHTADSESVFAAVLDSPKLGAFDLVFDPLRTEPIIAGQMISRENRLFLDAWTSFKTRSMHNQAAPLALPDMLLSDYRIEATIGADLDLKVTTRVKVRPSHSGVRAVPFGTASGLCSSFGEQPPAGLHAINQRLLAQPVAGQQQLPLPGVHARRTCR